MNPNEASAEQRGFTRIAWAVLGYTLLVILWGAVVRITGSGAGCGQHWPTCHGEIIPTAASVEKMIEFSHRVTSGLSMLAVFAMTWLAHARFPEGHLVRRGAKLSTLFIIIEAAIGAGLVLLELVAENASVYRGIWVAVHLANTLVLMGVIALTVWWSRDARPLRFGGRGVVTAWLYGAVALVVLTSMAGAISALGHTLFPVDEAASHLERITDDPWADTNYPMLVRLVHPALSLGVVLYLWSMAADVSRRMDAPGVNRAAIWLSVAVGLQTAGGILNIAMSAPGWMQVLHLAMANGVWLTLVWLAFEVAVLPTESAKESA